jgi:hypothetical protein
MIKLIKAKKDIADMEYLYKLRNHQDVRKFSKNKSKILREEHIKWFLDKENKFIYIIKYKKKNVGYIRANNQAKPFLSWAIDSKYRGKDFGSISLKKFLKKKKFKTCFALIDEKNIPSLLMAIKNNFKIKIRKKNSIIFQYKE